MTATDAEVFEWIKDHYAKYMSGRLLEFHRRCLVDQDYSGMLAGEFDKVLQTVQHARACIAAGYEPLTEHQHTHDATELGGL